MLNLAPRCPGLMSLKTKMMYMWAWIWPILCQLSVRKETCPVVKLDIEDVEDGQKKWQNALIGLVCRFESSIPTMKRCIENHWRSCGHLSSSSSSCNETLYSVVWPASLQIWMTTILIISHWGFLTPCLDMICLWWLLWQKFNTIHARSSYRIFFIVGPQFQCKLRYFWKEFEIKRKPCFPW